jgi:hypothetical protein
MAPARYHKPWWEQRPKTPGDGEFEAERERLRAELARAWRALASHPQPSAGRGPGGSARPLSAT